MRRGISQRSGAMNGCPCSLLFLIVLTGWASALDAAEPFFVRTPNSVSESPAYRVFGTVQPLVVSRDGIRTKAKRQPALKDSEQAAGPASTWIIGFEGANQDRVIEAFDRRRTRFTYLGGRAPGGRIEQSVWGGIRIRGLYPGVDLEIVIFGGRPVLRIVASKEVDLDRVRIRVEGEDIVGAGSEALILEGGVRLRVPPILVPAEYSDHIFPTHWPRISQSKEAPVSSVGDPAISTFLGGGDGDCGTGCATTVDSQGRIYIAGMTESVDFPTTSGAYLEAPPVNLDAFVARLASDGSAFEYVTLLGGALDDTARALAVDDAGCAVIAGNTTSDDFPTTPGAFDRTHSDTYYPDDAFITILNSEGTALLYSTFLGGDSTDLAKAIAIDSSGHIFVTGAALSGNFPTTAGAFDRSYNPPAPQGESDAFFAVLSPDGNGTSDLLYGTYIGSGADESASGLAVDTTGNAFISGTTSSTNFPTTSGAWDTTHNGNTDAFILKLSPGGNGTADLLWSSFLGHSGDESGTAVAIGPDGEPFVLGNTNSSSFPVTAGAFDSSLAGNYDLFVTRLTSDASALVYSTFIGGSDREYAGGLYLNTAGEVIACGGSRSGNFPTTYQNAYDQTLGGDEDAVFFVLDADGSSLLYSSFYGGSEEDFGYAVAPGPAGDAVIAGRTRSSDFPISPGAAQTVFGGGYCFGGQPCDDAFMMRISFPMIFADAFESGDLGAWSSAAP